METIELVQDSYVSIQGLRLHYREWGSPDAPDLLILHGLTGHAWEFDGIAEQLSRHFHVVALNQRGHGASDHASIYAPAVMAHDIGAVIKALGLTDVRVVGHSMGGVNAWLFAARNPDLIERLAILDVGPDALESVELQIMWFETLQGFQQATYTDPEDAVAEYLAEGFEATAGPLRDFVLNNLRQREDGQWIWRFDAGRLSSFIDDKPTTEHQWEVLRRVTCPTLVVRAGASWALSLATAERMVTELPDARYVEIPDSGHDIHIDQPEALLTELRGFLEVD